MQATLKRERSFVDRMRAAIDSLDQIGDKPLHPIDVEEFLNPECDQLRYRFWLGADRELSATYTFTVSSNRTVDENLRTLRDFVHQQAALATQAPD